MKKYYVILILAIISIRAGANMNIIPDQWNDLSALNIGYNFKVYPKIDGIVFNVQTIDGVVVYQYGPNSRDRFLYLLNGNHRHSIKYGFIEKELRLPKDNTVIYLNGLNTPVNYEYFKSHRQEFAQSRPSSTTQSPSVSREQMTTGETLQEQQYDGNDALEDTGIGVFGTIAVLFIIWIAFKMVLGGGKKNSSDKYYKDASWFHDNHKAM